MKSKKFFLFSIVPVLTFAFFCKSRREQQFHKEFNIISQRVSLQLTRALSLRLITDSYDYSKELSNSVPLIHEYHTGTVFYFGIGDNQEEDDSGIWQRADLYYSIKFSHWW